MTLSKPQLHRLLTYTLFTTTALALAATTPIAMAACLPDPSTPDVTNHDRDYQLSEIGGCGNLVCWIDNLAGTDYANATLTIDQTCTLQETLHLPPRFVLAGVGMDGEGALAFENLGNQQAAIALPASADPSGITIRDLRIAGDDPYRGRGIALISSHQVIMERVRISGFAAGIYGQGSFSAIVDKANLHNNNINLWQDATANTWRVTNSILNQSLRWGIYQTSDKGQANQNSSVYANNRLESNGLGGMRIAAVGTVVQNNEFEGNGGTYNDATAILVTPTAIDTRILGNFYSGDCPVDNGTDTEVAFDIHFYTNCP